MMKQVGRHTNVFLRHKELKSDSIACEKIDANRRRAFRGFSRNLQILVQEHRQIYRKILI